MLGTIMFLVLLQPSLATEIPFELNRCGLPVVRVEVGGHVAYLVVDTGATNTRLDHRFPRSMLKDGQAKVTFGRTLLGSARVTFKNFTQGRRVCGKLDGLLGNDILGKARRVIMDNERKKFVLDYTEVVQ